jgi:outer membrane murein-binding lipoprotein Lpp
MRPFPMMLAAAVAATLLLAGCSTPRPARELALQGAVMADKAQAETHGFVQRADQAYARREAIVRELARGEIEDVSAGDFRAFIAARAGLAKEQQQIDLINELADRSRQSREAAEQAVAAMQQKLADAAGPAVQANVVNLAESRKAFLVLSQELTPAEWLAFTQAYLKQLNDDLQALGATKP